MSPSPIFTENVEVPLVPETDIAGAPIPWAAAVNAIARHLERTTKGWLEIEVETTGDYLLTRDLFNIYLLFDLQGSPSGVFNFDLPNEGFGFFAVRNSTAQVVTVRRADATGADVEIEPGDAVLLYHLGAGIFAFDQVEPAVEADPFVIVGFHKGEPLADEVVFAMAFERTVTFPDDFVDSDGFALDAPATGSVTIDIERSAITPGTPPTYGAWTKVGELVYATSGALTLSTTATGTPPPDLIFANGDRVRFAGPTDWDGLANFTWSLQGTR